VDGVFAGDLSNFGVRSVVTCMVERGEFAVEAWLKTPALSAGPKQATSFVHFRCFAVGRHGNAVE